MFDKLLAIIGLAAALGLLFIITTTTPASGGATVVLALFILLYISLIAFLTFLIYWLNHIFYRLFYSDQQKPIGRLSFKRAYYYGTVLALAPVILISMKSVGKSGPAEWLLVAIFLLVGYIYVSRQTR